MGGIKYGQQDKFPLESALYFAAGAKSRHEKLTPSRLIRLLRRRIKMSQAELAARAGLSQAEVSRIESGRGDPRLSVLRDIFHALSCRPLLLALPEPAYHARYYDKYVE